MQSESRRVHKGKIISVRSEVFLELDEAKMTVHYHYPEEYYVYTNKHGEMQVYYPDKNETLIEQNPLFSSENEVLLHFFTNRSEDLGLKQAGFSMTDISEDGKYLVTSWMPPPDLTSKFSKAELVHENYLPIFMAFYNTREEVMQKIFFSKWESNQYATYPTRITQIDFVKKNDSIVSRKTYENILFGDAANEQAIELDIPDDAKLINSPDK
jgi:hypothetical protein